MAITTFAITGCISLASRFFRIFSSVSVNARDSGAPYESVVNMETTVE